MKHIFDERDSTVGVIQISPYFDVQNELLPMRRPTQEGRPSSWQIIEPYVSTEEKSHLSVRDFFWPYLGVSNTPYLGTDVTFMYVSLPLRGLGVVSVDVSVSEIGGPFRGE